MNVRLECLDIENAHCLNGQVCHIPSLISAADLSMLVIFFGACCVPAHASLVEVEFSLNLKPRISGPLIETTWGMEFQEHLLHGLKYFKIKCKGYLILSLVC